MDEHSSVSHDGLGNRFAAEPPPRSRKRRHRWIWVVVLLAFGLLFYWVLHHQQKRTAAAGQRGGARRGMTGGLFPVTVPTAQTGKVGVYLDAIGTVTPLYTVSINP